MGAKELEKAEEQGLEEYFKLTSKVNTGNMMCFDFDGKIKKYNAPEEVIEDFYPIRLKYYQKRKVRHLALINIVDAKSQLRITWPTSFNSSTRD